MNSKIELIYFFIKLISICLKQKLKNFRPIDIFFKTICILILFIITILLVKAGYCIFIYDIDWNFMIETFSKLFNWEMAILIVIIILKNDISNLIKRLKSVNIKDAVNIQTLPEEFPIKEIKQNNISNDDKTDNTALDTVKEQNGISNDDNSLIEKYNELIISYNNLNEQLIFEQILNRIFGTQLAMLEWINVCTKIYINQINTSYYSQYRTLCYQNSLTPVPLNEYLRFLFSYKLIIQNEDNSIILTDFGKKFIEFKNRYFPLGIFRTY